MLFKPGLSILVTEIVQNFSKNRLETVQALPYVFIFQVLLVYIRENYCLKITQHLFNA